MTHSALRASIQVGLSSLPAHAARAALSTTGIVIGVMALVATFSITDGVDRWSRALIERESSVQDVVISARVGGRPTMRAIDDPFGAESRLRPLELTLDDWSDARRAIPGLADASLTASGSASIGLPGRLRAAQLTLATANLPDVTDVDVLEGRFFTDAEVRRDAAVVVLGHRLASEIAAPRDPLWLIGRVIRVGSARRTVVGILAARPGEVDLYAFAPIGRALGELGDGAAAWPSLRLKAASVEQVPAVRDAAVDWLAGKLGRTRAAVEVTVGLERLQRTEEGMLLTKLIFGVLVAMMLAVGGIGVMNVMLVAVAERTREIGIRKAVGARRRDVLAQFLVEALAISGLGSALGAVAGAVVAVAATAGFRHFTHAGIYPVFGGGTLALVVLSALAVGVGFGTWPALRAARLSPVAAIARE